MIPKLFNEFSTVHPQKIRITGKERQLEEKVYCFTKYNTYKT